MITAQNITFRYKEKPVLHPLSLSLKRGECLGVLGKSGAGKSTLLRILAGLLKPTAGQLFFEQPQKKSRWFSSPHHPTAYLPQQPALFPHLAAWENIALGLRGKKSSRKKVAFSWLEKLNLEGFAHAKPSALSGGQQQRVALLRALAAWPPLLLLDEPLSHLDAPEKQSLRSFVAQTLTQRGGACVFITHNADDIFAWADRVLVLQNGQNVQLDAPEKLWKKPASLYAARLLGNVVSLSKEDYPHAETRHTLAFRPEQASLQAEQAEDTLPVQVVEKRFFAGQWQYTLRSKSGRTFQMQSPVDFLESELYLCLKPEGVLSF